MLKKFPVVWCGVVQSDYSVSSLSEKESRERERERELDKKKVKLHLKTLESSSLSVYILAINILQTYFHLSHGKCLLIAKLEQKVMNPML